VAFDQVNGLTTLAAQQQALQNRQSNLNAALQVGNAAGKLITPQEDWGNLYANADTSPLNLSGSQNQFDQFYKRQSLANAAASDASQAAYQQGNLGLQQKRFDWEKDQAGKLKDEDIARTIESSPLFQKQYDENGKLLSNALPEANKQQLAQYIASLGLPASEAKKWFVRYGLWSGK